MTNEHRQYLKDVRKLLLAAGKNGYEIDLLFARQRNALRRERLRRERIEHERAMHRSVEQEMVFAAAQLREDEMLNGKSIDYIEGFRDGRKFELDTALELDKIDYT